jgi:hypothetical protein
MRRLPAFFASLILAGCAHVADHNHAITFTKTTKLEAPTRALIPEAGISLLIPKGWSVLCDDEYRRDMDLCCAPHFRGLDCFIDPVLYPPTKRTLEQQLETHLAMPHHLPYAANYQKIKRRPFTSASGIKGLYCSFETVRTTSGCPRTIRTRQFRYFFYNKAGRIVRLGGYGNVETALKIIEESLQE